MVIRLNENSSISKRHSGSDNLDEEAKEMVTLDCALAKFFFFFWFPHFLVILPGMELLG